MSNNIEDTKKESQEDSKKSAYAKAHYLKGDVKGILIKNSIPMLIAMGAMFGFSLVDNIFIAKLGKQQAAAFAFIMPLGFLITGIAMGIGTGVSAVVSRALGEGKHEKVKRYTSDSLILGLLVVGLFSIIGTIFLHQIFSLFNAPKELIPLIEEYMYIWLPGIIFLVIPLISNAATRATGDTKTTSMIMMMSVLLNLIFDPIFIFGFGPIPAFGFKGAAMAAVISRIGVLILSLYILLVRDKMLDLSIPKLNDLWDSWGQILYVGLPNILNNMIMPASIQAFVYFISKYGQDAVAGSTLASRIELMSLTVFIALSTVIVPFVGQNLGAKQWNRIEESLKYAFSFSVIWGIATFAILFAFRDFFASMVISNPEVATIIVLYLSISPISIAFRGITIISTTVLDVLKKPILASVLTVSQLFGLFIPLAFVLSSIIGLKGIYWANVIGVITVAIISYYLLYKVYRELKHDMTGISDLKVV